jgi:hypothetical protein
MNPDRSDHIRFNDEAIKLSRERHKRHVLAGNDKVAKKAAKEDYDRAMLVLRAKYRLMTGDKY